ncbi:hypothetical protein LIER_17817 [Lithospermum erythrorhizon]|uniref:Uncharacterized protein n=1 Tax=Lithospermum erythrorhizon TaxID=34254 RepID=A0AAV3QDH6_LITER
MEDRKLLPKPQKLKAPPNRRDQKRYCEYYIDHGHDTDECHLLKAEIKKLIRIGYLKEFLRREQDRSPRPLRDSPRRNTKPRSRSPPRITGQIDTTSGGLAGEEIPPIPGSTLRAIVSPLHLKMNFSTTGEVGEASGDQKRARICYRLSVPRGISLKEPPKQKRHKRNSMGVMKTTCPMADEDNSPQEKESVKKGSPHEELELVSFSEQQPEKTSR